MYIHFFDFFTFTIAPNTGYVLSSLKVDGSAVSASGSYTFNDVSANHTIEATFTQKTYTITASAGSNGTISRSGSTRVNHG